MKILSLLIIFSIFCLQITKSSKILGVFSSPSKSHYFVGFSLMKGLANKGHEVTIIAPFKERNPVKNLKTIFIKETVPYFEGNFL